MALARGVTLLAAVARIAQGMNGQHPCRFHSQISELRACSTASEFCASHLGNAGPTYTHTKYATTTVGTDTTTVYVTPTATSTVIVSTITSVVVYTVTNPVPLGYTSTTNVPCNPQNDKRQNSKCGLRPNPGISAACNCLYGPTETVTVTSTGTPAGITSVATTTDFSLVSSYPTTTITITSTTNSPYVPTTTACLVNPSSFLLYDNTFGMYLSSLPTTYGGVDNYALNYTSSMSEATIFGVDQGSQFGINAIYTIINSNSSTDSTNSTQYYGSILDNTYLSTFYFNLASDIASPFPFQSVACFFDVQQPDPLTGAIIPSFYSQDYAGPSQGFEGEWFLSECSQGPAGFQPYVVLEQQGYTDSQDCFPHNVVVVSDQVYTG